MIEEGERREVCAYVLPSFLVTFLTLLLLRRCVRAMSPRSFRFVPAHGQIQSERIKRITEMNEKVQRAPLHSMYIVFYSTFNQMDITLNYYANVQSYKEYVM